MMVWDPMIKSWLCLMLMAVLGCHQVGSMDGVYHMAVEDTIDAPSKDAPVPAMHAKGRPFSFAKHFNNRMVLQKAPVRAVLHGFSPAVGHKVVVQMVSSARIQPYYYVTYVGPSPDGNGGVWSVSIDPMEVNVTADFNVISEIGFLALHDVIFGDVWICSGQSNMQFTVSMMNGAKEEIANASQFPNIRLMTVAQNQSNIPLLDLVQVEKNWAPASEASVGGAPWSYFSAVCWLYGKAIHKATGIPIGLIGTDWGGTPVEAWSSPDSLKQCGMDDPALVSKVLERGSTNLDKMMPGDDPFPQNNSVLWNSMIHPLLQMPIYGAIWYQGESDSDKSIRRNHYNCTFPAMIQDWRNKFHSASGGQTSSTFPFGFVQLSGNRRPPTTSVGFSDIRWHQTADYGYVPNPKMPQVFMAVAMDLPDFNSTFGSIHPQDKKDVGDRLSRGGLNIAYKQPIDFQGPLPRRGQSGQQGFILDYGTSWKLDVRVMDGFEFYCLTPEGFGVWVPTKVVNWNSTSVTLYEDVCFERDTVTRLRYAWRETPCAFKKCAVYCDTSKLPGPPFVVDLKPDVAGTLVAQFGQSVQL